MEATAGSEVRRTVCAHDCPDACSVLVTVEAGRVVRTVGDPEHPFTRGFLCGKVNRYAERVHSPERLLTPLRRVGAKGTAQFAPMTWDAALDEIVSAGGRSSPDMAAKPWPVMPIAPIRAW